MYSIEHSTVARIKPGRRAGKWLCAAMHAQNPRKDANRALDSIVDMGS